MSEIKLPPPSGKLHDDGYFTWSRQEPEKSRFVGWQTDFYTEDDVRAAVALNVPKLSPDATARREIEALREDAERYRWLKATDPMNLCFIAWRVPEATCEKWANNPDKAIDKARGK